MSAALKAVVVCLVLLLLSAPVAATPMLVLDVNGTGTSAVVSQGQTFVVVVSAEDIPTGTDGNGMFGFGFEIGFTPGSMTPSAPVIDAQWTGLSGTTLGPGVVGISANVLGQTSGPSGNGIALATIAFSADAPGVYILMLQALTGPGDNVLFDGTELDVGAGFFTTAQVTILATPEPSVALLLAGGLAALARCPRRLTRR